MRSKKCEAATSESKPGNANLPIGDGAEAQTANREIGVPRLRQPTPELKFRLGRYRTIWSRRRYQNRTDPKWPCPKARETYITNREDIAYKGQNMKLSTYLNFGGNCKQACRFYEEHLGGKITMMLTHGEQPEPTDVPPDLKHSILCAHIVRGFANF